MDGFKTGFFWIVTSWEILGLGFVFGSDSVEKHAKMSVSHMTEILFFTQLQL